MSDKISHGRGGAANITPDTTPYTSGSITREGPPDSQGDGPYSSGRGGVGNIDVDHSAADSHGVHTGDEDVVPETATRVVKEESHHVGRGGKGNEAHVHDKKKTVNQYGFEKEVPKEGLVDKIKEVFHKRKE